MHTGSSEIAVERAEVISIRVADQSFWRQLNGTIDYGLSYTGGNSQYQTQLSISTVYNGEGYIINNDMSSLQRFIIQTAAGTGNIELAFEVKGERAVSRGVRL